ncbi:MAG: hypothetical protein KDK78_11705, partial [Chlamydiia bacterium]|nr:hypothetical protein [Chlamydiia bacterium]
MTHRVEAGHVQSVDPAFFENDLPIYEVVGKQDIGDLLIEKDLVRPYEMEGARANMLAVLEEVERRMPQLLMEEEAWSSIFIDYSPPHLYRLFRTVNSETLDGAQIRVSLHYFLPASGEDLEGSCEENLYHPHSWAAAMHLLDGDYYQHIGYADRLGADADPRKLCILHQASGSRYAMNDRMLWHQVIPKADTPVTTLMVTYIPPGWEQKGPKPQQGMRALSSQEMEFMLTQFTRLFP